MECGGSQPAQYRLQIQRKPALLAGRPARLIRGDLAYLLFFHGAHIRRPQMDGHLYRQPAAAGYRLGFCRSKPEHQLHYHDGTGAPVRLRRRQLLLQHVQYQFLFPQSRKRHCSRPECRLGQSGGICRTVCRTAHYYCRCLRSPWWRAANLDERRCNQTNLVTKRRLYLGAFHYSFHPSRLVWHERFGFRQSQLQRPGRDFQPQA